MTKPIRSLCLAFLFCSLPAMAQNVQNGAQLFATCASCHGNPPAGGPERAQNQPQVIANAINTVPAMAFLRGTYTNAQLADIAAYIAFIFNPTPEPVVPTQNYTDLWFDPAQSGWGINITQHPSHKIFSLFYLYETPNKPLWISMPDGEWTTPTRYTGKIYRVSGPPPTGAFDPSKIGIEEVGTATFTFNSSTSATFVYTIKGVTVTRTITRFQF